MRYLFRSLEWFLLFCIFFSSACFAQAVVQVAESQVRLRFVSNRVVANLTAKNVSHQTVSAHILLELINTRGASVARAEHDASLQPGETHLQLTLAIVVSQTAFAERANGILTDRLRYAILRKSGDATPVILASGIIAASVATPDIFELRVAGPEYVSAGGHYTVRVRTIHPTTGQPVPGVTLRASLDLDDDNDQRLPTNSAVTDRHGFAELAFALPQTLEADEIDITVSGNFRGYEVKSDGQLPVSHVSRTALNTDKAIYQPGQILHARFMAFDPQLKALAGHEVAMEIRDPEGTLVFRSEIQTSSFGIASADWQIPENLRLGNYRLEATLDGADDARAFSAVKVSRYDLPTFRVNAKSDRQYYLPGQNASVEVSADYIFGEPVKRGHVRVVQEASREWNFREQKWEVEEGASYEGDTRDDSKFIASVDLSHDFSELRDNDYERFRDLTFAAYFTDSSTGKTEQRRFALRLTKYPIHIYITSARQVTAGFPLEFYLSSDYANGSAAPCDVDVFLVRHISEAGKSLPDTRLLRRVTTNRYGIAKVTGISLSSSEDFGDLALRFVAHDRNGKSGVQTESDWHPGDVAINVYTNKALYSPGEPVEVHIASSIPDIWIVVEASHAAKPLFSQLVHLRGGRATVVFGDTRDFSDDVAISAYALGTMPRERHSYYSERIPSGSHTILFPKDRELKVDVKFEKSIYRPGEEAQAQLRVAGGDRAALRSDLGLVVVDRAVEERDRTDGEFGARNGFFGFRDLWNSSDELAGVRREDLNKVDLSKPVPEGFDLVAEVLLQGNSYPPETFDSDSGPNPSEFAILFSAEIEAALRPLVNALNDRFKPLGDYPASATAAETFLRTAGFPVSATEDPWGVPFRLSMRVNREFRVLEFESAGPDKKFGTDDDFVAADIRWRYFQTAYDAINRAASDYHTRTGGFIRNPETLAAELARSNFSLEALRDPWGHAYRFLFGVRQAQFTITATSAGPDGKFSSDGQHFGDDVEVGTIGVDYFAATSAQLDRVLFAYFQKTQTFPQNIDQFFDALHASDVKLEDLRDPWGHAYYVTFREQQGYSDDIRMQAYDAPQGGSQHTTAIPVTRMVHWIFVRSAGEDGIEGTADDFTAATFSRTVLQQIAGAQSSTAPSANPFLSGASGAILVTVDDPQNAAIESAIVSAKNAADGKTYVASAGKYGEYLLRNVPAGLYLVQVSAIGFQTYSITSVPVRSSNITHLAVILKIGKVSETVNVEATRSVELESTNASVASVTKRGTAAVEIPPFFATPRLREYFPETLFWQPELITDAKGRAQLKFPLADNITTWKLSAVATTINGDIGTVEKDIRAFQPFFIEYEPPRFLTVGDEIALPVVLRNYLARRLQLNVEMKPAAWFTTLSAAHTKSEVASGDAITDVFRFKALNAVNDGKQEIDAIGAGASDAISKVVTVHPDGEEKAQSQSQLIRQSSAFDLAIPTNALPGSVSATLKVYPNLTAHVLEGIEAILERPYGCGEQTISSTYPSILLLKFAKAASSENSPLLPRARRYAQLGYQRLLSYRVPGGGFSYWGRDPADLALTAYAIRFLSDASQFVKVDDAVIGEALGWLLSQAQPDGRWKANDWNGPENPRRSAMLTSYIARVIVEQEPSLGRGDANSQVTTVLKTLLPVTLHYLRLHADEIDEPYEIASYALAAFAAGDNTAYERGIAKLVTLEHREGDASYWSLELNTPFYGWGFAGRIETTAVVLRALEKDPTSADVQESVSRGLLFLLRSQDRYGIWYSTQATVNVLDTLTSLTASSEGALSQAASSETVAVTVDGVFAGSVALPPHNQLSAPLELNLSKFVGPGNHHVELRRAGESPMASGQLVAAYYVPWSRDVAAENIHHEPIASDALRLTVHYDKQSANIGETIQCSVEIARVGFRGYGMLLAEIGLPPGAEVERESLDRALSAGGWEINQYDVLPDRLIVYLWPRAGGTKFTFTLKPRFGLNALSARSILYDYYNPEEHATVPPVRFVVH